MSASQVDSKYPQSYDCIYGFLQLDLSDRFLGDKFLRGEALLRELTGAFQLLPALNFDSQP